MVCQQESYGQRKKDSRRAGQAACVSSGLAGKLHTPIVSKCNVLRGAHQQVVDKLAADLRPGVDAQQMARLVGGVATVADQGELPPAAVEQMLAVIADGLLE